MKHQQGFTLIELLIVVLIAAILATIAYPSYQNYIRQTRLASVRTQMLHNAQQLERYYTQKYFCRVSYRKFAAESIFQY